MAQVHTRWVNHRFRGGWATDFGPTVYSSPQGSPESGTVDIPFLVDAQNVIYELNGGPRTMPGTAKLNSTTLGASSTVRGIYDYWRQGASGSSSQRLVCHVDTRVVTCQLTDGVFSNIGTGFVNGAIPAYSTLDDLLILSNDASADVPRSWDQTTFQNLAGSPPNFSFSCTHKNRSWAAGVVTTPSRLYYSANLDPEDWTGGTSGSIDIDPSDGDAIVGLASFKDELWVFKGPNKGSIHRITGSAPADFARETFIRGITAAYQNTIFTLPNDLGFVSPWGTVHSLVATSAFGDYEQSLLSFPINRWLRANVNQSTYKNWWAAEDPLNGYVLIAYTPSGQTRNTQILMMDYRFMRLGETMPRWAKWTTYSADSLSTVIDTNRRPNVFVGLNDGFVYKTNQSTRAHNGNAVVPLLTTPAFTYGADQFKKALYTVGIELAPKNNNTVTFNWRRDGGALQTDTSITQGGSAILGPTTYNPFTLNTSILGSGKYITRYSETEEGGEFRSIDYQLTDTTVGSELEVHGILTAIQPAGISTEND